MSVPPSGVLCNVSESILSLRTPENDKKWNKIVKLLPDRWHRELEGYIVNDDETEQAITDIVAVEVQRKGGIDYLNGIEDQLYGNGIGLLLLLQNSNSTDDVAIKMLPALAAKFDQIRSALVSLEAHVARPPSNQRGKSSAKVASPVETLSSSSNCTPINAKSLGDSLACASDIFRNQRKDAPFKEEKENMRVASVLSKRSEWGSESNPSTSSQSSSASAFSDKSFEELPGVKKCDRISTMAEETLCGNVRNVEDTDPDEDKKQTNRPRTSPLIDGDKTPPTLGNNKDDTEKPNEVLAAETVKSRTGGKPFSVPNYEATGIGPNEINPQFSSLQQQAKTIQTQMTAEQLAEVSENKVMAYYKERSFIQLNTQLQELLGILTSRKYRMIYVISNCK